MDVGPYKFSKSPKNFGSYMRFTIGVRLMQTIQVNIEKIYIKINFSYENERHYTRINPA
jgi:hypothetical protein